MTEDAPHRLKVIAQFLGRCMRDNIAPTVEQITALNAVATGAVLHQVGSIDIPRFLQRRQAAQCLWCMVEVPADKLAMPARCSDNRCPLSVFAKEPA